MPVNEKKLLEKFITIRAALNVLAKECIEAQKELSEQPTPKRKRGGLTEEQKIRFLAQKNRNKIQVFQ